MLRYPYSTDYRKGGICINSLFTHRQKLLQQKIARLESELKSFPEGHLISSRNGNFTKWYQSIPHQLKYIPASKHAFAEKLAQKKILELELEDCRTDFLAIDSYLRISAGNNKLQTFLSSGSGVSQLALSIMQNSSVEHSEWQNKTYDRCTKHPENLIHKVNSHLSVRSKSECLIALSLIKHSIPFRYECGLPLGNTTLYPDFTILHPFTKQIIYWEHFGLMDDENYVNNVIHKLQLYAEYRILPFQNLLLTYENKEAPLTFNKIEDVILMNLMH